MTTFLLCDECHEPITRLEEGGWQMTGERMERYAHYGMCPKDIRELWAWLQPARHNHLIKKWESEASLGDPELPVEPIPQSL